MKKHSGKDKESVKGTSWTKSQLQKLVHLMKRVDYKRGHVVYNQGDNCENIYFVYSGEFELIKSVSLHG